MGLCGELCNCVYYRITYSTSLYPNVAQPGVYNVQLRCVRVCVCARASACMCMYTYVDVVLHVCNSHVCVGVCFCVCIQLQVSKHGHTHVCTSLCVVMNSVHSCHCQ